MNKVQRLDGSGHIRSDMPKV